MAPLTREAAFAPPRLTLGELVTHLICPEKARLQAAEPDRPRDYGWALRDAIKAGVYAYYQAFQADREPRLADIAAAAAEVVLGKDARPVRYDVGESEGTLLTDARALAALLMTKAPRPSAVVAVESHYRVPLGADLPPLAGTLDLVLRLGDGPPMPVVVVVSKRAWSDTERRHNLGATAAFTAAILSGAVPETEPYRVGVLQFVRTTTPSLTWFIETRTAQQSVELYRTALGVHRARMANAFPLNRGWGCAGCEYDGQGCGR